SLEDIAAPGHRREPFAIFNLTWMLGVGAALCALAKIASVAGLNPGAAMLIFRSTNIFEVILGGALKNFQFLAVVIWLYALALYMQAEWPIYGRSEREVNVLAIMLSICSIIVIAVGPWQAGLFILLVGGLYVTKPVYYLAQAGWLGDEQKRIFKDDVIGLTSL